MHKYFFDIKDEILYNIMRATAHGSLAQLDRATHYECVGRGFESLKAHQKGNLFRRWNFSIEQVFFIPLFKRLNESRNWAKREKRILKCGYID